jgi:hypothetical protein
MSLFFQYLEMVKIIVQRSRGPDPERVSISSIDVRGSNVGSGEEYDTSSLNILYAVSISSTSLGGSNSDPISCIFEHVYSQPHGPGSGSCYAVAAMGRNTQAITTA